MNGQGRSPARRSGGRQSFVRPTTVTLIAVMDFVFGAIGVGMGLLYVAIGFGAASAATATPDAAGTAIVVALGALAGVLGAFQVATGIGLLGLKPWARTAQLVLAGLSLLGIPCGTIIGALVLVYMLKPEVGLLFSGRSPRTLTPEEAASVDRLGQGSGLSVALIVVLVLLVGVVGTGIVAAIAIPSLLRARVSANEAAALGDLRTMVSAQAAYASTNTGHYDTVECLSAPWQCIPGYPETSPEFLDTTFSTTTRHGYVFQLVPGAAAAPEYGPGTSISPSSFSSYAYVAVPTSPGQTGVRAFCADHTGVMCFSPTGQLDGPVSGACPESCTPFQ